jgi:hypothetical protein
MRQGLAIAVGAFGFLILAVLALEYRNQTPRVPPPLQIADCLSPDLPNELPNARFTRRGGRYTRDVKVWRQRDALTVEDVGQGRDLRTYDTLEVAAPEPRVAVDPRREQFLAPARDFLWKHWRERTRAYLILTASSVDATSTSHVFIEKDEFGRWRLYWRIVRHHGEVDDLPTIYVVRRVTPVSNWHTRAAPLPEDAELEPGKYRLELLDICGESVGFFW